MAKRIMRAFKIAEISAVDRPAQAGARMTIMKGAGMATNFGKAAEAEWDMALSAYAKRHNLSRSAATLEFANTVEANEIYKRTRPTPRSDAMAKAAAVGNVSSEELAKAAFPDLSPVAAMNAWLNTPEGREFYSDSYVAKIAAEQA
jgi:hypothetical protein